MDPVIPFILRLVRKDDLDAIHDLSQLAKPGLTSLSKDKHVLEQMIQSSVEATLDTKLSKTPYYSYFFVLEERASHHIVGTSRIIVNTGTSHPHYSFECSHIHRHCPDQNISVEHELLQLHSIQNGPTEIGTLFLHPEYRHSGLGKLLSLGRFLFMASFPDLVEKNIIAQLRGISSEDGISPFWESVGKQFFTLSFNDANELAVKSTSLIEDLIPKHPIYTRFLSKEAQDVIGKEHPLTTPALKLLEKEGFLKTRHIDILDAGPRLVAKTKQIRSIRESVVTALSFDDTIPLSSDLSEKEFTTDPLLQKVLISSVRKKGFAAFQTIGRLTQTGLDVSSELKSFCQEYNLTQIRACPFSPLKPIKKTDKGNG
jgi:arginine N-succinyltransferase